MDLCRSDRHYFPAGARASLSLLAGGQRVQRLGHARNTAGAAAHGSAGGPAGHGGLAPVRAPALSLVDLGLAAACLSAALPDFWWNRLAAGLTSARDAATALGHQWPARPRRPFRTIRAPRPDRSGLEVLAIAATRQRGVWALPPRMGAGRFRPSSCA